MLVGGVQQVSDAAAPPERRLLTQRLLQHHEAAPLSRQTLVDVLRRPQGVHLQALWGQRERQQDFTRTRSEPVRTSPVRPSSAAAGRCRRVNW